MDITKRRKIMSTTAKERGYKMKKKLLFAVMCILAVAVITAACGSSEDKDQSAAGQIGSEMSDSVQNLIENGNDEPMGTINGEDISKAYFKMRSELYRVCGFEKPADSAWEELKLEAAERGFAEAKGILPSEDEILEYTKQQRETAESTEESHNTVREMLQNIGMTEDYYWNVYQLKYESPVILTRGKIEEYKAANNLDKVDYKEVEVITDKDYYESLN